MNRNTFTYYLLLIAIAFIISGCKAEDSDGGVYCTDCLPQEPESEKLIIKLTINNENQHIPITIYKIKFSLDIPDTLIIYKGIKDSAVFSYKVKLNNYYSVKAEYKVGSRTIYAIDGGSFKEQKQSGCDNDPCWQIFGGIYDTRIKDY